MATTNDQLRTARERTASPTHPSEGLTRQELAELVNTYIWDHHNKKIVALNANYVGKLERGHIRWPGKLYREALHCGRSWVSPRMPRWGSSTPVARW